MKRKGIGPYGSDQDAPLPGAASSRRFLKLLASYHLAPDAIICRRFVKRLLDPTQAADMPRHFPGMPLPGGEKVPMQQAEDSAASFNDLFPGAGTTVLANPYDHARRHTPRQTPSAKDAGDSFDKLFRGCG